jgi:hypothetical protein
MHRVTYFHRISLNARYIKVNFEVNSRILLAYFTLFIFLKTSNLKNYRCCAVLNQILQRNVGTYTYIYIGYILFTSTVTFTLSFIYRGS